MTLHRLVIAALCLVIAPAGAIASTIVVGSGARQPAQVRTFDTATLAPLGSFLPFGSGYQVVLMSLSTTG